MHYTDYFEAEEGASDLLFAETMGKAEMPPCVIGGPIRTVP